MSVTDSPLLLQENRSLREALRQTQQQAQVLRAKQAHSVLDSLPPLAVIKRPTDVAADCPLTELSRRAARLHKELNDFYVSARVVDISKRKPGERPLLEKNSPMNQLIQRKNRENLITQEFEALSVRFSFVADD